MTDALAAIRYAQGFPIDNLLAAAASRLKAGGLRLGGVIQRNAGTCEAGCLTMTLEDLASGRLYPISEDRGPGARGCRLDAAGLAEAGGAVAAALAADLDLVIVNKFGKQEALGHGLRAEIAAALGSGLPVLVAVRHDLNEAWRRFAGEDWVELAPDEGAIEAWLARTLGRAVAA